MLNFKKLALVMASIAILAWSSGLASVQIHEEIHKTIYNHYGIPSEVHINYYRLTGYTQAYPSEVYKCTSDCQLAQGLTEAIGYSLNILIYTLWACFLAFWIDKRVFNGKTH